MGDNTLAVDGDHAIELLVVRAAKMHILPQESYPVQDARNFPIRWHGRTRAGILCIENQAAAGAGQLAQREGIPMLLEEPPHLRLFPAPSDAEFFQSKCRAIAVKLDDGRVI